MKGFLFNGKADHLDLRTVWEVTFTTLNGIPVGDQSARIGLAG